MELILISILMTLAVFFNIMVYTQIIKEILRRRRLKLKYIKLDERDRIVIILIRLGLRETMKFQIMKFKKYEEG